MLDLKLVAAVTLAATLITAAPAPTKKTPAPPADGNNENEDQPAPSTGLYYDQYLQTIVKLLESDEDFRKTMENADFDEIKSGKLSKELYKIPGQIRDKLDDAKREEYARLRKILHAKSEAEKGRKITQMASLKQIAEHLDHDNPHSFEEKDLTFLIKAATKDLENFDEKRHQEFKRYEMAKELKRQEKLQQMSEEERRAAERQYQDMRKKHEDHPNLSHPGSKDQLFDIWKTMDGLSDEKFDSRTFFMMRDVNGDGRLDPAEVEAIFESDLSKVYDKNNPEDDMFEMVEERIRMREHVMKEVDLNGDGTIDISEFLKYTKTPEFVKPDENSYKTVDQLIDDDDLYTKEELQEFKEMIAEQEAEVKTKLEELRKQAQTVVSLKSDMYAKESKISDDAPEHEKESLREIKEVVEEEEKVLKEMHEDLKEQSNDLLEMKAEVHKQEQAARVKELNQGGKVDKPPPVPMQGELQHGDIGPGQPGMDQQQQRMDHQQQVMDQQQGNIDRQPQDMMRDDLGQPQDSVRDGQLHEDQPTNH